MTDRAALRGSVSTSFWTPVFSRSSEKKAQLRAYFTSRKLLASFLARDGASSPIVRHVRRMCATSAISHKFANKYGRPPATQPHPRMHTRG